MNPINRKKSKFALSIISSFLVLFLFISPTFASMGSGAAFSGNTYIYSFNGEASTISVISGTQIVKTIKPMSSPGGDNAYDPVNGIVYVPLADSNVALINSQTNKIVHWLKALNTPSATLYVPASGAGYILISSNEGNFVYVVKASTNQIVKQVAVGSNPSLMSYDPPTNTVWVANSEGPSVSIINVATWKVVKTLTKGFTQPGGVAYNPSNGMMYVTDFTYERGNNEGAVFVFNATSYKLEKIIMRSTDFATARSIIYDPANDYMYVAASHGGLIYGTIAMISGTKIVKAYVFTKGTYPTGLAYNPSNNLVYVSYLTGYIGLINGTTILSQEIFIGNSTQPVGLTAS